MTLVIWMDLILQILIELNVLQQGQEGMLTCGEVETFLCFANSLWGGGAGLLVIKHYMADWLPCCTILLHT